MTVNNYYVDITNGNDENDGLSIETAWATITKAADSVVASDNGDTIINIAPGNYRERISIINGGFDNNRKIIYRGDPNCKIFTNSIPSVVRITASTENDLCDDSTETLISCNGKSFVDFEYLYLDGGLSIYAIHNSSRKSVNIRWSTILGTNGCSNVYCYSCYILARDICALNTPSISSSVVIGGNHGASGNKDNTLSEARNCLFVASSNGVVTGGGRESYGRPFYSRNNIYLGTINAINGGEYWGWPSHTNEYALHCTTMFLRSGIERHTTFASNRYAGVLRLSDYGGIGAGFFESYVSVVDISPRKIYDRQVTFDYDEFKYNSPSIKLIGKTQYIIKVSVQKGSFVKYCWVKSYNTKTDLMPYIVLKFAEKEYIKKPRGQDEDWELLSVSFESNYNGVAELILVTQDPSPESYTLFSNIY